ncbi:hypothetical protein BZZ01_05725 [Nostocales cyanobacterium HT-58-2]|nr:hypothetical protein BZZ01_05725 [Nostocales cyanobacterium HT-58-2]
MEKYKRQTVEMSKSRLEMTKKAREAHQFNIRRSLEHRLEVARAKGDENLIRQLEAEMRYFS